ncbi:MAG: hypothetical protein IT284_00545 [Bacteroidetes bacterium]|nr:hypothetical protein [Bacteroidota bacterium]
MNVPVKHQGIAVGGANSSLARIKELTESHFLPGHEFFVIIGSPGMKKKKLYEAIRAQLPISDPEKAFRWFRGISNTRNVGIAASTPGCIGVIAFGLTKKVRLSLELLLDQKGVRFAIDKNGEKTGDEYAIFSPTKQVWPNELVLHVIKLLELYFDQDHFTSESWK